MILCFVFKIMYTVILYDFAAGGKGRVSEKDTLIDGGTQAINVSVRLTNQSVSDRIY